MSLGIRKLVVLLLIGAVFLVANTWVVARWLESRGVVEFAKHIREEYLTGTAIAVIAVLLVLVVGAGRKQGGARLWQSRTGTQST